MDLWDFPALSAGETPEEAVPEIERLRKPDESWRAETPLVCRLEDWIPDSSHRRYTISVEGIPFECLYLPGEEKSLNVLLAGGGVPPSRRYPLFSMWSYHNYFGGHMLCIDDPMYHFHSEICHVMWYYGDKESAYLLFVARIVKKAMECLRIPAQNVLHMGVSGGGYAALYLCNLLDCSSALAGNPQLILKPWQYPTIYENFLKWGVNLEEDDAFHRNRLRLTNETCSFFILINCKSKSDYAIQFQPFAQEHGIPVRYGLSQHKNFATFLYATDFRSPHLVFPQKTGYRCMQYLLRKMRMGANLNELRSISATLGEILTEKYAFRSRLEKEQKARKTFEEHLLSLCAPIVLEEWQKLASSPRYPLFYQSGKASITQTKHPHLLRFHLNERRDAYYVLFCGDALSIRFIRRFEAGLTEGEKNVWVKRVESLQSPDSNGVKDNVFVARDNILFVIRGLESSNHRESIREFILQTMDLWRDEPPEK